MGTIDDKGGRRVAEWRRAECASNRACGKVVYFPRITSFQYINLSVTQHVRGGVQQETETHHSGARAKGSSFQMTSPSEISVVAIRPFPFIWSKYSTRSVGPFCVYLRGSRPSRSLLKGCLSSPVEPGVGFLTVLVKPRLWRTFRVRFSLTSHLGFSNNSNVWSFGIPKVGFSPRSVARAEERSESEGGIRVSDIADERLDPRLEGGTNVGNSLITLFFQSKFDPLVQKKPSSSHSLKRPRIHACQRHPPYSLAS